MSHTNLFVLNEKRASQISNQAVWNILNTKSIKYEKKNKSKVFSFKLFVTCVQVLLFKVVQYPQTTNSATMIIIKCFQKLILMPIVIVSKVNIQSF